MLKSVRVNCELNLKFPFSEILNLKSPFFWNPESQVPFFWNSESQVPLFKGDLGGSSVPHPLEKYYTHP